ncbi:GAF domain-containing protein [Pelagovum pacificum]|uniref:GAF domain-containing protein n=1 Tax=Pelagovum pacificum TaxID=2588711 RepID=A0A5C5G841_9RHOB|nr:GAF domain-containing protein [Pelagovum pacificum]QQA41605.1 GAF domain-containing protein [Pelagovum pacificum]TNY30884.1 GAF domain-containing protein [Pelagovum pacificum]
MSDPYSEFDAALDAATTPEQAYDALRDLARATVGAKLFTVMELDREASLARRAYTSHPVDYPASGTKPFRMDGWFDTVVGRGETFVANHLSEIAQVFPDHELIGSLGCGSVINLPLFDDGQVKATVNLLDAEEHYTPDRVARAEAELRPRALRAWAAATAA